MNKYYTQGYHLFGDNDELTAVYPPGSVSGPALCFVRPDRADELLALLNREHEPTRIPVTGPTTPATPPDWQSIADDAMNAAEALHQFWAEGFGSDLQANAMYRDALDRYTKASCSGPVAIHPVDKPATELPINVQNVPKDHPAFTLSAEPETKAEMIRRVAAENGITITPQGEASFTPSSCVRCGRETRTPERCAVCEQEDNIIASRATLPPDPDNQNEERADWANVAVAAFIGATNTDDEDAIADLICDLGHLCDRHPELGTMGNAITWGLGNYMEETDHKGKAFEGIALPYAPAPAPVKQGPRFYCIEVIITCLIGDGDRPDSCETFYFSSYDNWCSPVVEEMLPRLSPALPFGWNNDLHLGDNEDRELNLRVHISELVPANFPLL